MNACPNLYEPKGRIAAQNCLVTVLQASSTSTLAFVAYASPEPICSWEVEPRGLYLHPPQFKTKRRRGTSHRSPPPQQPSRNRSCHVLGSFAFLSSTKKTGRSPPPKKKTGGSHPAALSIASASPSRFRSRPSSRFRASLAHRLLASSTEVRHMPCSSFGSCGPRLCTSAWRRLASSRAEPSQAKASCVRGRFGGVSSTLGPCGGVSKQGGLF